MEFDKSKVYTALNADELKVGSKVIVSNCISELKELVANYKDVDARELIRICSESSLGGRFETTTNIYHFAYLLSEPELKWTDLKAGDVIRHKDTKLEYLITGFDKRQNTNTHVHFAGMWVTDDDLRKHWKKVE